MSLADNKSGNFYSVRAFLGYSTETVDRTPELPTRASGYCFQPNNLFQINILICKQYPSKCILISFNPAQNLDDQENFHIIAPSCKSSKFFNTNQILKATSNHPHKMQLINASALACALLSASGLAYPNAGGWKTTATIQLANDQSGANANVAVPVDGVKRSVEELWGHTAVAQHGLVFASSAQLTAFDQTTVCTITEEPHLSVTLDAEKTWVSLGGHGHPVDLCSAFVVCECEGM
jgi:hypothetical protein